MKKISLLITIASIGILVVACSAINCITGSGKMITETRNVSGFSKVDLSGGYSVKLSQGNSESLKIEAEDNIMEHIITEVKEGTLYIHLDKSICKSKDIELTLSVKDIEALKASGAVSLETINKINSEKFDLKISGAGEVDMDIDTKLLTTKISGAGELKLRGKADTHAIDISGAGEVDAYDFAVNKYALDLSGASECKINVSEELNVTASGASEINYKGNPSKVRKEISGASDLNKIN